MEQLDCGSSGNAVRKARGSKRSKDSKYRSSLPRKIEQPDIFSDETLFDTVDTTPTTTTPPAATPMPQSSTAAISLSQFPLVNEQTSGSTIATNTSVGLNLPIVPICQMSSDQVCLYANLSVYKGYYVTLSAKIKYFTI